MKRPGSGWRATVGTRVEHPEVSSARRRRAAPPMATVTSNLRAFSREPAVGRQRCDSPRPSLPSPPLAWTSALATCALGLSRTRTRSRTRTPSRTVGGVGSAPLFLSARSPAARDPGVTPRRIRGAGGGGGAQAPRGK